MKISLSKIAFLSALALNIFSAKAAKINFNTTEGVDTSTKQGLLSWATLQAGPTKRTDYFFTEQTKMRLKSPTSKVDLGLLKLDDGPKSVLMLLSETPLNNMTLILSINNFSGSLFIKLPGSKEEILYEIDPEEKSLKLNFSSDAPLEEGQLTIRVQNGFLELSSIDLGENTPQVFEPEEPQEIVPDDGLTMKRTIELAQEELRRSRELAEAAEKEAKRAEDLKKAQEEQQHLKEGIQSLKDQIASLAAILGGTLDLGNATSEGQIDTTLSEDQKTRLEDEKDALEESLIEKSLRLIEVEDEIKKLSEAP